MDRAGQLSELQHALAALVSVLALDPQCGWRRHFESSLDWVHRLQAQGFTQADLNELSGSVMHVYGGHGSLNDYAPVVGDGRGGFKVISGMEQFAELSRAVHEKAFALRVAGHAG